MAGVISDINANLSGAVDSYRTLAGKAVRDGNGQTGAVAALERFFHKLEFLLKYGRLPSMDDITGGRLPSELQGLKAFLESGTSHRTGDSYVLQRNATERYCFSWQASGLNVSRETCHVSMTAVRSGYTGADIWRKETTEEADSVLILRMLNGTLNTHQPGLAEAEQVEPEQAEAEMTGKDLSEVNQVKACLTRAVHNGTELTRDNIQKLLYITNEQVAFIDWNFARP